MTLTKIRFFTAVVSLLFSIAAYYYDDIINRDGVMYMEMVQAYMQGGLGAMAEIYNWGFFPLLVAWLSKLFSSPFELTADALNTMLFVIFTDALLLVSHQILPNLRQLAIAAVLILGFYTLNEYRDFVIRDIGYWAFTTLALYHLFRFNSGHSLFNAISWQLAMLIAVLFRIEGLVLLALLPLIIFYNYPLKSAFRHWLTLNSLIIPASLVLLIVIIEHQGWAQAFGKFKDYLTYLNAESLSQKAEQRLVILETQVLSPFSASYSGLILYSGLLVMLLYKLINGLSFGYLVLLGISWWQNRRFERSPHSSLLVWFFALNLLILVTFLFHKYFVATRYCVMAITGLFLLALPSLIRLIEQNWLARRRGWLALIIFIIFAGLVDTFHSSVSKTYIKNVAIWAAHELPPTEKLITNDEFIQYYLKKEQTGRTITYRPEGLGDYKNFDYLLLVEKRRTPSLVPLGGIKLELIHQEANRRGDHASIYRISHDK